MDEYFALHLKPILPKSSSNINVSQFGSCGEPKGSELSQRLVSREINDTQYASKQSDYQIQQKVKF